MNNTQKLLLNLLKPIRIKIQVLNFDDARPSLMQSRICKIIFFYQLFMTRTLNSHHDQSDIFDSYPFERTL